MGLRRITHRFFLGPNRKARARAKKRRDKDYLLAGVLGGRQPDTEVEVAIAQVSDVTASRAQAV